MANSESEKSSNKISDAEEKEIIAFLRGLDCCEDDAKRLLIESKRLFVILYDHDSRRRGNVVDRNAIVKSIIIIAESMIDNGLHHYSWTKLRSSKETTTMIQ